MTEITEAVERLHHKLAQSSPVHLFSPAREDVRALLSELTRLQEENGQLRLAICGGEDAPGYADSLPLADILGVAANNIGSWREASDRAALLQAAREEASQGAGEPVAWTGRTHDLKTWPTPYDAVAAGLKPWELRLNDRDYQVGDRLRLRRWVPVAESYSGEETTRQVAWLLKGPAFGLPEGYVIMSLSPPDPQARLEALEGALTAAADQLHRIMRVAEMSSGIMLDPRRTGNWPGAQKTADAFDRIGLRAAEAKAAARAALNQGADHSRAGLVFASCQTGDLP